MGFEGELSFFYCNWISCIVIHLFVYELHALILLQKYPHHSVVEIVLICFLKFLKNVLKSWCFNGDDCQWYCQFSWNKFYLMTFKWMCRYTLSVPHPHSLRRRRGSDMQLFPIVPMELSTALSVRHGTFRLAMCIFTAHLWPIRNTKYVTHIQYLCHTCRRHVCVRQYV